jgi:hypothetical protein
MCLHDHMPNHDLNITKSAQDYAKKDALVLKLLPRHVEQHLLTRHLI